MMNPDQARLVAGVYRHFIDKENTSWTEIDDLLDYLEYLDDDQLHKESDVIFSRQVNRNARCDRKHDKTACFIPLMIEAVSIILDLYKKTNQLHKNNRYILQYHIACSQSGIIITD